MTITRNHLARIAGGIAALVAAAGILAPWITAQAAFANFSVSGTRFGEIAVELLVGVVVSIVAFVSGRTWAMIVGPAFLLIDAIYVLVKLNIRVDQVQDNAGSLGIVSIGWGAWLIGVMAVVAAGTAIAAIYTRPRREPSISTVAEPASTTKTLEATTATSK